MSGYKNPVTLKLNEDQVWIVSRALLLLSSDVGVRAMLDEYPDADLNAVGSDINSITNQLFKQTGIMEPQSDINAGECF